MLCNLQQIQGHHSFCFVHVQDRILSGTILTYTKENVWIQGVVVRILTLEKKNGISLPTEHSRSLLAPYSD